MKCQTFFFFFFFFFFHKETICLRCQILFSWKKQGKILSVYVSSGDNLHEVSDLFFIRRPFA